MKESDVLRDALTAPDRGTLERHRQAILELRKKSYSWREIAAFLNERGIATDHTKVFRFIRKAKHGGGTMTIPTAAEYKGALAKIRITDKQRLMLEAHYHIHNRTITSTKLAEAAGEASYKTANLMYGRFGANLGQELKFPFEDLDADSGEKFYSSAIGMVMPPEYASSNEVELLMHHELAKALDQLNWFPA